MTGAALSVGAPWFPPRVEDAFASRTGGPATSAVRDFLRALSAGALSLNAVTAIDADRAYADAERLDALTARGHSCGPLHGMPILVKDNIDVRGLPSTNGSSSHDGSVATSDAVMVSRLRAAGAIPVGKTNMDEIALGVTGANSRFPRARNARDPLRLPGGSSGGSAVAVAAGLVPGALGTDTAGSVRTPSAFNGVTAIRPTTGLLSTDGVTPLSPMFDTIGPIGRNAGVVLDLLDAMLGSASPHTSWRIERFPGDGDAPLAGLRIGVPQAHFFEGVDPEVAAAVRAALEVLGGLGAEVVDLRLTGAERAHPVMSTLMLADAFAIHRELVDGGTLAPPVKERVELGRDVTLDEYRDALAWQRDWRGRVARAFDDVDLVMTPTTPIVAPTIGDSARELESVRRATQFTVPWSLAGMPAVTVPCGIASGMPVGAQLVGPAGSDRALLRVARRYEHETLWSDRYESGAPSGAVDEGDESWHDGL